MTLNLNVSDIALKKLQNTLGTKEYFRIRVDPGGCFGFQYIFIQEKEKKEDDIILEKEEVKILIDPQSVDFLENAELCYVDEMMGSHFFIKNPQAESSCGCKNSFSLKL